MEIFHCDGFRKLQWCRAVERCENLGGQVVVIQDLSKENLGGTNNNPRSFEEEGFAFLSAKIGSGEGGGGTIAPLPPGSDGPAAYRFNNERQTKFSLDRTKIDDRRQFFSPFVLLYRKDYM